MTKEIELTQGQVTLVDDEDYEYLSQWKWCAVFDKSYNSYKAFTNDKTKKLCGTKSILMHRYIMKFPQGLQIDHINHNTLDNRKENLRIVTGSQNCMNIRKHGDSFSVYKGVRYRFSKNRKKHWMAVIEVNGKRKARAFLSELEAAHGYDFFARKYFGEFAIFNFPKNNQAAK